MTLTHGTLTFEVEKLPETGHAAYRLKGKRGALYTLLRNQHNPKLLFPVNARSFAGSTPFEWVRETDDGQLVVIR